MNPSIRSFPILLRLLLSHIENEGTEGRPDPKMPKSQNRHKDKAWHVLFINVWEKRRLLLTSIIDIVIVAIIFRG